MSFPTFRYHPDPIASGSIKESPEACRCCRKKRGFLYTGPVYAEAELDDAICPWCIAEGTAHSIYNATFVDSEAFTDEVSEAVQSEICERTPGYSSWQSEQWPVCCHQASTFIGPFGIAEVRARFHELEGEIMSYIVYDLGISGGAANQLLNSLHKNSGPTAYIFQCQQCLKHHFHIDGP